MLLSNITLLLILQIQLSLSHGDRLPRHRSQIQPPNSIPLATREYWMRRANLAVAELDSPCLMNPFGTAIVNHTDLSAGLEGKLVCLGVNHVFKSGNPTVHGEIAAINNCTSIFTDEKGVYRMGGREALRAFRGLSLYTNGEPCPMCATAIRWSGFAELIYGTSAQTLSEKGWIQMSLSTEDIFKASTALHSRTRLIKDVLANETDPLFSWQFDERFRCPKGCERSRDGVMCEPVKEVRVEREL